MDIGEGGEPANLPYLQTMQSSRVECAIATGTLSIDAVEGGLEVELDREALSSAADPNFNCTFLLRAALTIEFVVPELGGAATMMYLLTTDLLGTFSSLDPRASASIVRGNPTILETSSLPGGQYLINDVRSGISWTPSGVESDARTCRGRVARVARAVWRRAVCSRITVPRAAMIAPL